MNRKERAMNTRSAVVLSLFVLFLIILGDGIASAVADLLPFK